MIKTIIIIAISVAVSTFINVLIMRKVTEMAVEELKKIEEKYMELIKAIANQ